MTNTKRVADQIAEFMAAIGGGHVFVLTGNGAMYLNDAIEQHPTLEYLCVHNEAVAAPAAAAYAEISGAVGIVNVTAGPGATNALAGLAEAWVDSGRVLIVAGQVPTSAFPHYSSAFEKPRSFGIAGINSVAAASHFSKAALQILDPKDVEPVLRRAKYELFNGRPGPVWIEVPLDVQGMKASGGIELRHQRPDNTLNCRVGADFSELGTALSTSKRPLFILGRGTGSDDSHRRFSEVLHRLRIPFAPSRVVAHKHSSENPLCLGTVGVRGKPFTAQILGSADLVVGIGTSLPTSMLGSRFEYLARDAMVFRVDIEADDGRLWGRTGTHIQSDAIDLLSWLESMAPKKAPHWASWAKSVESGSRQRRTLAVSGKSVDRAMDIYEVVGLIERALRPGDILTSDAGSTYYAVGQACDFASGATEVTSGTFAAMGMSLPLAIGAAAAMGEGAVCASVTGDGSFELNLQELLTLKTYDLSAKVFIINNGGYASMRTWQEQFFDGRYIGSSDSTGTPSLNFEKIANAFEICFTRVATIEELKNFLLNDLRTPGPAIVELLCDPSQELFLPMEADSV